MSSNARHLVLRVSLKGQTLQHEYVARYVTDGAKRTTSVIALRVKLVGITLNNVRQYEARIEFLEAGVTTA